MTVTLPPRLEALVRQKVEAGRYRTVDEVIEEALGLLDARDRLVPNTDLPSTPEPPDETEREADDLSLADLRFVTSEEMQHAGFPFSVPDDLSTRQGHEIEAIMARGAPEWVRALRRRSGG